MNSKNEQNLHRTTIMATRSLIRKSSNNVSTETSQLRLKAEAMSAVTISVECYFNLQVVDQVDADR